MIPQYGQDRDSYTVEQRGMTSYPSQNIDRAGHREMVPHMGNENENLSVWRKKLKQITFIYQYIGYNVYR